MPFFGLRNISWIALCESCVFGNKFGRFDCFAHDPPAAPGARIPVTAAVYRAS